jgi:hypothetical protein
MKVHELFEAKERSILSVMGKQPEHVDGDFYCSDNKLTSLEGAPSSVGGNFSCSDNKLKNLIGGPKRVDGDFFCGRNELESLEGSPETVGIDFYCQANKLKSLVGITKKVKDLCVNGNQLTNLHNIHKMVDIDGAADFLANPITSHVLGLLMMPKLEEVYLDNVKVLRIINKHIKGDKDIFACQEELIEAGLDDYAQL